MYGRVADRYKSYTLIGEPFKVGSNFYIMAQSPIPRTVPIKVRFYRDNKCAASNIKPLHELFGFKSEDDSIQVVMESKLTAAQRELFLCNWERGFTWKFCTLFGGCWYSPLGDKPIPSTENIVEIINWQDFYAEGRRTAIKENFSKESRWLK